jgi:Glycosyl hydrolase family 76
VRITTPAQFLAVAEADLARTRRAFWNPKLHWYDQRLSHAHPDKPLASLWSAMPLFEALDAVATADPTPANVAEVRAFVRGAERYYNPSLRPVPAYEKYPGITGPRAHTYFDDDGWWEMAFLDAYRVTHDARDLRDAERAFRFIAVSGWDPVAGGVWWETLHRHKTSEGLAAEIYGGFDLYRITGERSYLATADKLLSWANRKSWNGSAQLYQRNATDDTVLDYVEGLMIGAQLERCEIDDVRGRCTAAERLAQASVKAFPHDADWTPAADMIYLRFLLDLYEQDGNADWYDLVLDNAEHAFAKARSSDGLFFKGWDGRLFPTRLLQPDAGTLALFAWLGGAKAPA